MGDSSETDFFRVRIAGSRGSATVFELARFEANEIAVWSSGYADLSGFAGQTVRVWIEAVDAGSSSLVEAAVDDVIVTHAP